MNYINQCLIKKSILAVLLLPVSSYSSESISATVGRSVMCVAGAYVLYSLVVPSSLEQVMHATEKASKEIFWRWLDLFTAFDKHNVSYAQIVIEREGKTFEFGMSALAWYCCVGLPHEWMGSWCQENTPLLRGAALLEHDIITLKSYKLALESKPMGMTLYPHYETLKLGLYKLEESLAALIMTAEFIQQKNIYDNRNF